MALATLVFTFRFCLKCKWSWKDF